MSNLKQISLGFYYYVDDKGMFPTPWDNSVSEYYYRWTEEMIDPTYWEYYRGWKSDPAHDHLKDSWKTTYIDDFGVMACPSDKGDLLRLYPDWDDTHFGAFGTSYWYNCRDYTGTEADASNDLNLGGLLGRDYSKIRQPAMVAVLGDPEMSAFGDAPGYRDAGLRYPWHDPETNYANIVFADFHVAGIICHNGTHGSTWTMVVPKD